MLYNCFKYKIAGWESDRANTCLMFRLKCPADLASFKNVSRVTTTILSIRFFFRLFLEMYLEYNKTRIFTFYILSQKETRSRSGVQVKKENEKLTVVCSRSPKNLEFAHFTLLFCRGQRRNVPKCKMHMQSDCFCPLNLSLCGVVVVFAIVVAFKAPY